MKTKTKPAQTVREYVIARTRYSAIPSVKMTLDEVRAIVARFGYTDWRPSKIDSNGAIAENPATGFKLAVDVSTGDWCHYRNKTDRMVESVGFQVLGRWLAERAQD